MKVTVTRDFYDLMASMGRKAGDVIEVPENRGTMLIKMRFVKAEGAEPERAETPKAKAAAKTAAKKRANKTDPKASA